MLAISNGQVARLHFRRAIIGGRQHSRGIACHDTADEVGVEVLARPLLCAALIFSGNISRHGARS